MVPNVAAARVPLPRPMDGKPPELLFFVVKEADGFAICEGTREEMFELTIRDGTLDVRLDRTPFKTRAEAEARLRYLLASKSKDQL